MLKTISYELLPEELSYRQRFQMALNAGFTHVEMKTVFSQARADEVAESARSTGLKISSVVAFDRTAPAYLAGSPENVERAIAVVRRSIENASQWGANAILAVAGYVDRSVSPEDAYAISQRVIREQILPLAEEKQIIIGLENIRLSFLKTNAEYLRYIDEFNSPFVRAYVDVGNVVEPQDLVRAAGGRIVSVHLKDLTPPAEGRSFGTNVALGDGAIDQHDLRSALDEVGYDGAVVTVFVRLEGAMRTVDRVSRSRFRRFLPPPVPSILASIRRRVYSSYIRDLGRRYDKFAQLA